MILECHDLHKSYGQGEIKVEVLKGLSLKVDAGEVVAIVGKSGSGKSTLLSLLSGLDHPCSGKLELLGKNIFAMPEKEITKFRAQHMGIIFQNFHLLPHLSALENVSLPLEILGAENSSDKAMSLLESVGLGKRSKHLPDELSGGEKQRVAVARALAISPEIILADEPSGSLDEETSASVMDLLFELITEQNRAMIVVTHDQDLAMRCSRRYSLDHGVLHEIT